MANCKTAEEVRTALLLGEMETQWHIERKGWKLAYVPHIMTTYYEKEIKGKRWTLTVPDAFAYELKEEEPSGYEY
jgi:hypothetical protein